MKFYRLHEEPNAILVTAAYNRHYGEKLKEEYPEHEIIESELVPLGYSYLVNKDELMKQYQEKTSENNNQGI
jgi:hypothetical protein